MGLVCGFVKTENKSRQVSYAIVGVLLGADYRVVSFNASSTRVDFMREFKKSKISIKNKLNFKLEPLNWPQFYFTFVRHYESKKIHPEGYFNLLQLFQPITK